MTSIPLTGLVASSPAAWASSGRHLVIPFGRVLRVYDVFTSPPSCIASLQGHSAAVVSVVPAGNMRVASASYDGTVRIWDVSDGSCLRTIDVGQGISAMCEAGPEKLVCFGARSIVLVSVTKQEKSRIRSLFVSKSFRGGNGKLASPVDGSFLAVAHRNFLHVRSIAKGEENRAVLITHYSWFTSVAVSCDGSTLAVGDESGAIFVYRFPYSMLPESKKSIRLEQSAAPCSKLHWHSSPVRGLSLSQDGNVLVSGASEAVLVTWKLTRNHFGTRSFLPRLRAPILAVSISNDETAYALTQADNSVRIINQVSNTIASTIRGIRANILDFKPFIHKGTLSSKALPGTTELLGLTRDPRHNGHVLISGRGGDVQCFDLVKGQHVSDIAIVAQNVVNAMERHKSTRQPESVHVTHVKMSPSGNFMVTVDRQSLVVNVEEDFSIEQSVTTLRFWTVKRNGEAPCLSSAIVQPHGVGVGVSSVCCHPRKPIVVTTACDGKFKLWREVRGVKQGRELVWRNEVDLGYKDFPCLSACFSNDGSLLAVGCGSVLTMWHVEDMLVADPRQSGAEQSIVSHPELDSRSSVRTELLHALVHPPTEEAIQAVSFTHKQFPLFITATDAGIYVWNALTQGIWWSSRIPTVPRTIATDESSGCFALVVRIPAVPPLAEDRSSTGQDHTCDVSMENGVDVDDTDGDTLHAASTTARKAPDKGSRASRNTRNATERLVKRGRAKGRHERGPAIDGASRKTCRMDSAIVIFDATSPYPLRISRLPTGVEGRSLEFVRHSGKDGPTDPLLVCLDSNLEVTFYSISGNDDGVSDLTHTDVISGHVEVPASKPMSTMESLYGQASDGLMSAQNERGVVDLRVEVSPESPAGGDSKDSLFRLFNDYFDGPVHVQAPVASKSCDFINAIIHGKKTSADIANGGSIEDASSGLSQENPRSLASVGVIRQSDPAVEASEFKARWEFCRELVKSQGTNRNNPNPRKT